MIQDYPANFCDLSNETVMKLVDGVTAIQNDDPRQVWETRTRGRRPVGGQLHVRERMADG